MNKFECPMCKRTVCDARQLKKHLLLKKKKCYSPEHSHYVLEWVAKKGWKNVLRTPKSTKKSKKLVNFDDDEFLYPTESDDMIYPTFKFQTFLALTLIYNFRDPTKKRNVILNNGQVLVWNNNKKNIMSWDNFIRLLVKKILNDERSPKYWKKYFNNKRVTRTLDHNNKVFSTYQEFLDGQYATYIHQNFYLDSKQTVKNVFEISRWLPKSKKEIGEERRQEEILINKEIEEDKKIAQQEKRELEEFRRDVFGTTSPKQVEEPEQEVEPVDDFDNKFDYDAVRYLNTFHT